MKKLSERNVCSNCSKLQNEVEQLKIEIEKLKEDKNNEINKSKNIIDQLINHNNSNEQINDINKNDKESKNKSYFSFNMFIFFMFFCLNISIKLIFYMFTIYLKKKYIMKSELKTFSDLIFIDILCIIVMLIIDSLIIDEKKKIITIFIINIFIYSQVKDEFINEDNYIFDDNYFILLYGIRKIIKIWFINKIYLGCPKIIKLANSSKLLSNIFFCIIIYSSKSYIIIYNILFSYISISIIILFYYYDELKKCYKLDILKYENKKNNDRYDEYIFIKKLFIILILYINNNIIYLSIIILLLFKLVENSNNIIFLFIFDVIGRYLYNYNMTFINNNNKIFCFIRLISIITFIFVLNESFSYLFKLIIVSFFGLFDGLYKRKINSEYGSKSNNNVLIKITFLGF